MTGGRRSHPGGAVVAGRRPVLEALRSGLAREVLVATNARSTPGLREVREEVEASGVTLRRVPVQEISALTGGGRHQGVVARVEIPRPLSESDLARREWDADALVLVLDGISDPQNLGSLARTAEAAGARAMVARRRRSAGSGAAALRASAGSLLHLPMAEVANVNRAVGRLKEAGFWVVGLDARASRSIDEAERPAGRLAVVVGSEGIGLSRLVREACDELIRVPMHGRVASLNVSVAAGVALYGYALRRPKQEQPA